MTNFNINVVVKSKGVNVVGKELDDLDKKGDRLGNTIRNAFAFLGGALLVRELVELSDTYTNLQNRLRLVTDGTEELQEATAALLDISNETRVSFAATGELYARTAIATRELGRSQEETLQFTKSLNQAVILSGASAQEAQAGLIQLSQGLASGTLRGDELRSVLEQLPLVADVIARQMGVTRGELRELGKEGEITAEIILDAFKASRQELEDKFSKTVPTIGQAFTVLKNNLISLVGQFQQGSTSLAELVLILADAVEGFDDLLETITPDVVQKAFGTLSAGIRDVRAALDELDQANKTAQESFSTTGQSVKNLEESAERLRRLLVLDPDNELAKIKLAEVEEKMRRITVQSGLADEQVENLTATADKLRAAIAADPSRTDLIEKLGQVEAKIGTVKAAIEEFPDLAKAVAPPELSEAFQEIIKGLDAEAELLKKTNAEREVAKELAQIEKALAKEKIELNAEERAALETRLEEQRLLRAKADILNELRGPEEERAERERLVNELVKEKNITEAEAIELLKEKRKEEEATPESVIAALEKEVQLARLSNEEQRVQNDLQAIFNELRRDGASLNPEEQARVETLLRQREATQALTDLQAELAGSTLSAADIQQQFNDALADGVFTAEELAAVLEKINQRSAEADELPKQAKLTEDALKSLAVNGIDTAFAALDEFLDTGEFEFKEFAQNLISDSLKIIARLLLIKALQSAFGDFGGAIGGSVDSGLNSLGGARANGGRVNPNEDFLVGERGPELFRPDSSGTIIPAGQTAAMMGQPSSAPQVITTPPPEVKVSVVNVTDPQAALGALSSPDGEKLILNVLQKNKRTARNLLA